MKDPIVIAGMAVELPGGVDTLTGFWAALAQGREHIGPFPRDRGWPLEQLLSEPREGWRRICDAGGFLSGATEFDPTFFGIAAREAVVMDPQQRVALRVAWRALENTGINPAELAGADVGCFMGVSVNEYGPRSGVVNEHSGFRLTGSALGSVSGRISHGLGLVGPSFSIDTTCASALSAIHLAANAVRSGECDWALAGGVCVMGTPMMFFEFAKNNALAIDGHCRPYAADPTGTLWGEGAGVVVLEHESRAVELGHRIYGRLLGSRVNHNGRSGPMAVPSAQAQEALVHKTLEAAGIPAEYIDMIEGHGTATAVGDPIELTALQNAYGTGRERGPLLGSVKSNFGHAQAASGVIGLIKVLLAGANGQIPPSLFAQNPNPTVDWDRSALRLATTLTPWQPRDGIRYGAVSSFGVTGTNAHAILAMPVSEEANV